MIGFLRRRTLCGGESNHCIALTGRHRRKPVPLGGGNQLSPLHAPLKDSLRKSYFRRGCTLS